MSIDKQLDGDVDVCPQRPQLPADSHPNLREARSSVDGVGASDSDPGFDTFGSRYMRSGRAMSVDRPVSAIAAQAAISPLFGASAGRDTA